MEESCGPGAFFSLGNAEQAGPAGSTPCGPGGHSGRFCGLPMPVPGWLLRFGRFAFLSGKTHFQKLVASPGVRLWTQTFFWHWLSYLGDHNKLWKILQEMEIPDHLSYLPKKLYAGQEATVRTRHGTADWFLIGKEVRQGCILSSSLFNFYAEYIMQNAELDEAQAGIKIAGRNINNLRYADDATLMAESEEELKGLLMKVKEESEKSSLKLSIQKMKILASSPITSWQIDGGNNGNSDRFYFTGLQNHCKW